jgi:hypothetical protein
MENTAAESTEMKTEPTNFDFENIQARAEDYVRESPSKSAAIAFLAGFVVAMLPIGGIVGALVRLILFLVRPALMIIGIVKVYEEIQRAMDQ